MSWFPTQFGSASDGWRFDIVSLLTVVGSTTIVKHKQAITASPFAALPRLIPAPETLLDTDRPVRLPSVKDVEIVGIHSGIHLTELNFFASVVHTIEDLKSYEFRAYEITYTDAADPEKNGSLGSAAPIHVPLHKMSILNAVTAISSLILAGLFIGAGMIHDGIALFALVSITISTSTACLSGQWKPQLTARPTKADCPPGDIVLKTRAGAMIVVKCQEEIARELYSGVESCEYVFSGRQHQALLGISTVTLLSAIVLFGNCGRIMQVAVGAAYIFLNAVYWIMSLLSKPADIWDMERRYKVKSEEGKSRVCKSYTGVLWEAIRASGTTKWAFKFVPSSEYWTRWLEEAGENINNEGWDAEKAKDDLMAEAAEESKRINEQLSPSCKEN